MPWPTLPKIDENNYVLFDWKPEDKDMFESLRKDLTSQQVLGLSLVYSEKEICYYASLKGLGGMLDCWCNVMRKMAKRSLTAWVMPVNASQKCT